MTASHVRSRLRLLLVLAALGLNGCAGPVAPELVIVNAKVFTNDPARPWAEALAIKGERVIAVGASADVRATAGAATRVVEAGGRVLVPGFNDARVDLPLEPPTPAGLSAIDRAAIARGVTSLQVVAGGPMRTLVPAAQQAQRQARWRVIRSPMDGERPRDEKPYLPPQPGGRLAASGVAWTTRSVESPRLAVAIDRLPTLVGWAYGAEDPVMMSGDVSGWRAALEREGLAQVWQRKRPRFDACTPVVQREVAALARLGVVVTLVPCAVVRGDAPPEASAGALADAGIHLAAGSADAPDPMAVLSTLVGLDVRTGVHVAQGTGRSLSRGEAVRAATWGSAYAEKAERDKGWLGPGTLADLAVLSDDIFTVPAERLSSIASVLTVVGGAIVYDPGVLSK